MGDAPTVYIAAVSGGKDSTAMCLWLREQEIPYRAVTFDTGWEHPDTYRYLREVLPAHIGPIEAHSREPKLGPRHEEYAAEIEQLLGFRSPMVRWILKRGMFPSRVRRFCTQELKLYTARDVMRAEHEAGRLPVNVIGVRAAESRARARLPERELSPTLDCMVWRPLLRWTERDVIDIHKRHGVPPNPLYLQGARRVGCFPCIMSGKRDLKLLNEARIRVIERMEAIVHQLAGERAAERGGLGLNPHSDMSFHVQRGAAWESPALFQAPSSVFRTEAREWPCVSIRRMVEWGHTTRGGREPDRQITMPGMNDGCLRWGLCDLSNT